MKPEDIVKEARERFKESLTAEQANRELFVHDTRFENGDQWSDTELQQRVGRPCLTINKVAGAVKQIIGDSRQNRPRIKVRPVDSDADPLTAEIFTGLIRNIENISDAESAYDTGFENAVRGSIGYWRVNTKYSHDDTFDQDIVIERIVNPMSVYLDQSAIRPDYSDIEYALVVAEMKRKKFEKKHPKANSQGWEKGEGEGASDWFTEDSVRVAEYWYKEDYTKHVFELDDYSIVAIKKPRIIKDTQPDGTELQYVIDDEEILSEPKAFRKKKDVKCKRVMMALITGNEILEGPTEWPGKYIPIIPCLGEEVWIEGERVLRSAIRHATEPAKLYNWARSNNMETMSLAPKQPWIVTPEQIEGHEEQWNKAYTTPMPYLLYNHIDGQAPPQRLTGSVGDSGANNDAMMSADDIKSTTGLFDASLGARGNETSGKAINARQRQGDTATFVFTDNQSRAVKYTGKVLVDLIPKIYDTDRIVRLMGDDLQKAFANPPMASGNQPTIKVNDNGNEALAKINHDDKILNKVLNDLSIGKYDVTIDAGPGYATRRQEATDGMVTLGQAAPQIMPVLVPRIAKAQDWPDAQEIGDEIKAMMQPQQPPPNPKAEIDMQKGQIDLQKGQLDLEGKKLDLAGKAQTLQAGQVDQQQAMAAIAQKVTVNILKQIGAIR